MVAITQLRPAGLPSRRYGSFAGKEEGEAIPASPRTYTETWTQLRPAGLSFRRYGDFTGKEEADVTPQPEPEPEEIATGGGSSRPRRRRRIVMRMIDGIRFVGEAEALDRLAGRIDAPAETAVLEHELPAVPPEATTLRSTDFGLFDPLVSVPRKVGTDSRVLKRFVRELKMQRARADAARDEEEAVAILLLRRV
jgi:hypothetical protein